MESLYMPFMTHRSDHSFRVSMAHRCPDAKNEAVREDLISCDSVFSDFMIFSAFCFSTFLWWIACCFDPAISVSEQHLGPVEIRSTQVVLRGFWNKISVFDHCVILEMNMGYIIYYYMRWPIMTTQLICWPWQSQAGSSDRKVSMHMKDVFFGQMLAYHIVQ